MSKMTTTDLHLASIGISVCDSCFSWTTEYHYAKACVNPQVQFPGASSSQISEAPTTYLPGRTELK